MKKNSLFISFILIFSLIFTYCSKSTNSNSPDLKYTGEWQGFTEYNDTIKITIGDVNGKAKITYTSLIFPIPSGVSTISRENSDGLGEVNNDQFSFSVQEWENSSFHLTGEFQNEVYLEGTFIAHSSVDTTSGTYTADKK